MKKGFTLVELSIVLVIIGILVGGILVARSMIQTAKVQSTIRTIQQFEMATGNFKTKYNSLPGDSRGFGGNGDGRILNSGVDINFTGEIANFWVNLQQTGFNYQGKNFSATVSGTINEGNNNTPRFSMTIDSDVIVYDAQYFPSQPLNLYHFIQAKGFVDSSAHLPDWLGDQGAASPDLAYSVDVKIDDGKPIMGNVRANNRGNFNPDSGDDERCTDYSETNNNQNPAVVKYLIGNAPAQFPNDCTLMVKVLSQVGQ